MKLPMNKLAAACSLALAGTAAHANTLADFDSGDVVVYVGGATATDQIFENLSRAVTGGYCLSGTIDIFTAANQRAVFCETNGSRVPGFPANPPNANTQIAVLKESAGGSSNGVVPLIAVANSQAHALHWLDLAALKAATGCTTVTLLATDTGVTGLNNVTRRWNCNNTLTPNDTAGSATFDVNMGVSDTEPALSYPPPTSANINKLAVKPGVHVNFGIPVTIALYRALQQAQGKTQDDAQANVPSLTSTQIRGLLSGNLFDWNQITTSSGTGLASQTFTAPATAPANTQIYLCRRVASSGTEATAEAYWFGQRCAAGVTTMLEPNDGSTITDTTWVPANIANGNVNAGPSSGNVRSCLNNYNNSNVWALGVLSNELKVGDVTGLRFIAIDGVRPDLTNEANGLYDYYSENALTRIKSGNPGFIDDATDLRGKLITAIQKNFSEPITISQVNADLVRTWGSGGALAIPNGTTAVPNASPATPSTIASNPVDTSSKFGNNCTGASSFFSTPVP